MPPPLRKPHLFDPLPPIKKEEISLGSMPEPVLTFMEVESQWGGQNIF